MVKTIKFSTIKTDISFLQSPPKEYTDGTVPQVFHFTSCGSTRNRNEIRHNLLEVQVEKR